MILLDTHEWIWFLTSHPRLSPTVTSRIAEAAISAMTVWEVAAAVQRGRIEIPHDAENTVREWLNRYRLQVIPLDAEIALLSRTSSSITRTPPTFSSPPPLTGSACPSPRATPVSSLCHG